MNGPARSQSGTLSISAKDPRCDPRRRDRRGRRRPADHRRQRRGTRRFRGTSRHWKGGAYEIIANDGVIEAFYNACRAERTSDIHLKHKLKGTRRYDVHVAPLELDGTPQAIGYFYEVTQMYRLENIRQEFLSNISHELRTPLTSILAFVETLENGGLEDEENNRHFSTSFAATASECGT